MENKDNFNRNSISVDCITEGGIFGITEYRGIDNQTKKIVFENQIGFSSNNVGKFLSIVHGLSYCKDKDYKIVYSNSKVAINWVKDKECFTKLFYSKKTKQSFDLIEKSLEWLENNSHIAVHLWKTKEWGEISARYQKYSTEKEATENMLLGFRKIDLDD